MKYLGILGRIIYSIPLFLSGMYHFSKTSTIARVIPSYMPQRVILVYITGVALMLAAVSITIGVKSRLASILLGIMILSFALMIHLKGFLNGTPLASSMFVKDVAIAGAAFFMASKLKN